MCWIWFLAGMLRMCGSASSFMTFLMSLAIWCEIHQTSLRITKESCKRMSLKLSLSTHFLDTFCCYNLQQNCRKSLICKKITVYMYADANLSVWFNLYQNVYVYKNLNINWNWGNKWSAPSLLCVWWWLLFLSKSTLCPDFTVHSETGFVDTWDQEHVQMQSIPKQLLVMFLVKRKGNLSTSLHPMWNAHLFPSDPSH